MAPIPCFITSLGLHASNPFIAFVNIREKNGRRGIAMSVARYVADLIYTLQLYPDARKDKRLMCSEVTAIMMEKSGWKLDRIVICRLEDERYYMNAHFYNGDQTECLEMMPSEAMQLAIIQSSDIYIEEEIFEQLAAIEKEAKEKAKAEKPTLPTSDEMNRFIGSGDDSDPDSDPDKE